MDLSPGVSNTKQQSLRSFYVQMKGMQLRLIVCNCRDSRLVLPNVNPRVSKPVTHKNRRRWVALKLSCKRETVEAFTTEMKDLSPVTEDELLDSDISLDWMRTVWIPAVCVSGFLIIGYLVCGGADPSNPLLVLDHKVQEWVVSNIPGSVRKTFFARFVSNIFIQFDLVAGPLLMLVNALGSGKTRFLLPGMYAVFFYGGVGSHRQEGFLVHVLKACFHRQRPLLHARSPAFPSGHAMSTAFLTGVLLFVLLPVTCKYIDSKRFPALAHLLTELNDAKNSKWTMWVLSWVFCAVGRIGSNAHWVSDTVAGILIGIALTYIFKTLHDLSNTT